MSALFVFAWFIFGIMGLELAFREFRRIGRNPAPGDLFMICFGIFLFVGVVAQNIFDEEPRP